MIIVMITTIVTMIMGMPWQKVLTTQSMAMSTVLDMTMITSMSMAMDTAIVTRDRRRQLLRGLASGALCTNAGCRSTPKGKGSAMQFVMIKMGHSDLYFWQVLVRSDAFQDVAAV